MHVLHLLLCPLTPLATQCTVLLLLHLLLLASSPSPFALALATASDIPTLRSLDDAPVLHFTLARRGGPFEPFPAHGEVADLSHLAAELQRTEQRFNLTRRVVHGNRLVRKAKGNTNGGGGGGGDDGGAKLMGEVAGEGRWYARIAIGDPPQEIDLDLDMLTSDFFVLSTTSSKGSKFDAWFSKSYVRSNEYSFPRCSKPTDTFLLPILNTSIPLEFAHCHPSKSSVDTLGASGSVLGLASSAHLSQTKSPGFLIQLVKKAIITRPIFSLMLINGQEGVLSIGGTSAPAVDMVMEQTRKELDVLAPTEEGHGKGERPVRKRGLRKALGMGGPETKSGVAAWQDGWRWSKVQGAEGWWQILMQGVWVDGVKVLKNQPIVIDINSPFILAPPLAARAFYASISGSIPLPPPHQGFYRFPCLNPPVMQFEFDSHVFPAMQGGKGRDWFGMPGGKFSLGRYKAGSGYCVGAVVETQMGMCCDGGAGDGKDGRQGRGGGEVLAGNGMRDVWVLGEGWFRGVGGVFDFQNQKVGFRAF